MWGIFQFTQLVNNDSQSNTTKKIKRMELKSCLDDDDDD